jgi:hypothetical protein
MSLRARKIPPALKHAAYSATTLLPGEDSASFEKLHRALIAEFKPAGALEENIVGEMAHLLWRRQNLAIFRIAEGSRARREQIKNEAEAIIREHPAFQYYRDADEDKRKRIDALLEEARERRQSAEKQAREELGDYFALTDIGEPATIEGLVKELDVKERLDSLLNASNNCWPSGGCRRGGGRN